MERRPEAGARPAPRGRGGRRGGGVVDVTGERVRLRDGSRAIVRPVEPGDKQLLLEAFEQLSEQSRHRRFLGPKPALTSRELAFLTEVDHVDHEAIGALEPGTGAGLGVARYVRLPDRPDVAEPAVAVIDAWQGRGLGTVLLERLSQRATTHGIHHFRASLFTDNRAMYELFEHLGHVEVLGRDGGVMEIEVELPIAGDGLHRALAAVAHNAARNPPTASR